MSKHLSTEPYKGTRDFYPEDMAVQRYIFDTWSKVAESFGYERYDASVLEPSELYRSKTSEEIVNEQTYSFIDRGEREVTLRPEMTPTVARMIAAKRRDLSFPVRWYSIPNLFRYERPQRGRLREHWQLNCDIFGVRHYSADVEVIMLAYRTLIAFGATPEMFTIHLNDRALMHAWYAQRGYDEDTIRAITRIVDRRRKVSPSEFSAMLGEVVSNVDEIVEALEAKHPRDIQGDAPLTQVMEGLASLGITNVVFDASVARGFDYYTGTIFEILDTSEENNRSLLGGGRYDNLTGLFGGEAVPGVGFGMGDVVMRDFLETHGLLTAHITSPDLMVIPTEVSLAIEAEKIAQEFRDSGVSAAIDMSDRKLGKKIADAGDAFVAYALIFGDEERTSGRYTLRNLSENTEQSGTIAELVKLIT